MENVNYMIRVMRAFVAGEIIESMVINFCSPWKVEKNPIWNWEKYNYRVKSESEKVELDFSDDLVGHKALSGKSTRMITEQDEDGVFLGREYCSYENLRKYWTRPNGNKFEKEVCNG